MIEGEEQELILNTLAEQPQEEIRTLEEDIYVIGVESLNGQAGDLTLKNINGEDLVGEGNIALQTPLTETQMDAVDSGIDSTKVAQIATNAGDITTLQNTKQDNLTQTQLNAVNSGIDQTKVAQIATNTGNITSNTNRISTIEGKIPSAASSSNQLTDKNYVDNSIATNTANYISDNGQPFQSYADLVAYSGTLTNNDYAFVVSTDAAGNLLYTRYKYNAPQNLWAEEYTIANPTFTSDQWASINSGVTANDVSQIGTNKTDIATLTTSKQDALSQTQLDAVNSGINATKVQQIADNTTAIATKQDKLTAGANIQIASDGKTISATDTKYTAGTGLTLTGTQFSVTEPVPAGFFTDTAAKQEGEGTRITLSNTTNAPIDGVELKGNTYQQTYSGKNLFGAGAVATVYRCTASINDNILTVVPTGAGAPQVRIDLLSVIPAGSYTLNSATPLSNTTLLTAEGGTASVYNFGPDYSSVQFTTTAPAGRMTFNISDYSTTTTIDLNTLQIETGNQATSYEPYVGGIPSPNPDYPQPVQTVTGSQTVSVVGNNLFQYSSISALRCTYTDTNGKIVCTATGNNPSITATVKQIPAGTYTCSGSLSGVTASPRDLNNVSLGVNFSSLPKTITTTATMGYITFYSTATTGQTFTIDLSDFQIETGSTTHAYQPYESQSYTIDLGTIELCKIGTYQDYIWKDGADWKLHKEIESVHVKDKITWITNNDCFQTTAFAGKDADGVCVCSHFTFNSRQSQITSYLQEGEFGFNTSNAPTFKYTAITTTTAWNQWLTDNDPTLYYHLATATDTVITDAGLIAQLEALAGSTTYAPQTNYATAGTGTNLPVILTVEVFKNNYAGLLARLETAGA